MAVSIVPNQTFSFRTGADSGSAADLMPEIRVYVEICGLVDYKKPWTEGMVLDGMFHAKVIRSLDHPGLVCAGLYVDTANGLVLRHGVIISNIQMAVIDVYTAEGFASVDIQKSSPNDFPGLYASVGIDSKGIQTFGVRSADGSDLFLFPLNINN